MTTITREQQKQILIDTANHVISRDNTSPYSENLRELARIALASLTAEPVLYAAEETLAYANMGEIHLTCLSEPMGDAVIPLYTAQPVPIVPEEIEPDSNNTYDYVDGWNACRAALLQGGQPVSQTYKLNELSGNSPVSPGGWISCSERMPDNDESKPIAIFTGKCLGQGMFVATYDDDGFFDYWEGMEIIGVSHWMPLPAPPQQ